MPSRKLGVIAEDDSDVAVILEIAKRVYPDAFKVKKFVGKGCGRIKKKCLGWANALKSSGCSGLILLHDLDEKDERQLQSELITSLNGNPIQKTAVVIPVKEIEAWLLSDSLAIKTALKLRQAPKEVAHPQSVNDPKQHLGRLVRKVSDKIRYTNAIHNAEIAKHIRLDLLLSKCNSYGLLHKFLEEFV